MKIIKVKYNGDELIVTNMISERSKNEVFSCDNNIFEWYLKDGGIITNNGEAFSDPYTKFRKLNITEKEIRDFKRLMKLQGL